MKVTFGSFVFDSETRELLEGGGRVHVSPKAFDLLRLLLERRPNVVSKIEIHDRIWPGAFVGDANLSVVVAEIRQVLGDDSKDAQFIRTVHRVGYAFCGPVTERPTALVSTRSAAHKCWLVWNGRSLALIQGDNIVGRDPRCDVWLDASGVSRRHALIAVAADQVSIEDLQSSNGTFVRGRRLTAPHALVDGDEIELGAAAVTFRVWSDEGAKTERIARGRR
jgi:DNA-binding winged helix-turn-helix (wHTH) protein